MGERPDESVPAEIEPHSGQAREAASALQRLGFKILHIGTTVSVQAPRSVWESVFEVSFEIHSKETLEQVEETDVRFVRAVPGTLIVPEQLESLISAVYFAEPPEYFSGL